MRWLIPPAIFVGGFFGTWYSFGGNADLSGTISNWAIIPAVLTGVATALSAMWLFYQEGKRY